MDKKKSAATWQLNAQIYAVQGERLGWVDQAGYIHAFRPAAWVTPYGGLIGYVDSQGMVQMWGQRRQKKG